MILLKSFKKKELLIFLLFWKYIIFTRCDKLPEEILLNFQVPKCPNGQNALIEADGITRCGSGCPDGFNCLKKENLDYCCPDIDLLHKLYDNNDKDFYLNTARRYPEPKALTTKDVETSFPFFPNKDVWSNLATLPNTKILDMYDDLVNKKKNKKLMKISVLSDRKNNINSTTTTATIKNIDIKNNTLTKVNLLNNNSTFKKPTTTKINMTKIITPTTTIKTTTISVSKVKKIANLTKNENKHSSLPTLKVILTTTAFPNNDIRRKPLNFEQVTNIKKDLNKIVQKNSAIQDSSTKFNVIENNESFEFNKGDFVQTTAALFYYCKRRPLNFTCNNGSVFTQFVSRWYAKDNLCHMYTWAFCPGDTISMDKTLRSKEECEEICLGRGQKTNIDNNLVLKSKQTSRNTNSNEKMNINQNDTAINGSTDIDEIVRTMTVEDRTKFLINQKAYASKLINEDNSRAFNNFNDKDVETFEIADSSKQFICVRPDTFVHICPDGFPSQLTIRWFVYENTCITFPYGYCHGDRVIEETFAKTKKECEYRCLSNNNDRTEIFVKF